MDEAAVEERAGAHARLRRLWCICDHSGVRRTRRVVMRSRSCAPRHALHGRARASRVCDCVLLGMRAAGMARVAVEWGTASAAVWLRWRQPGRLLGMRARGHATPA